MKKIRLLVLTTMYPQKIDDNSGIFIHNQIKHLQKAETKVKVIRPIPYAPKMLWFNPKWKSYGLIPENDTIDEVSVYYPRYIRIPGKWFHSLSCYSMHSRIKKVVDSIIKGFKPHIIHTHGVTPTGYVGLRLKNRYKLPYVCSLRGSDIHTYPRNGKLSMHLTKQVISGADQLVSVSDDLKKIACTIAKPKREIQVIYNGCDLNTFFYNEEDRRKIRNELNILGNEKVIIFVGNISRNKGIFELIESFMKLKQIYLDLHLILVGLGPDYKAIQNIISSNGLNRKIHLAGSKPHNEIPHWLSAADIFVLPSYNEGLPNVVLEAMACGLPVVATTAGGIPEAIEDGESGILINKKDTESLKKAIEYLLKNEVVAKKMGNNGRRIVEHKFSWKQNVDQVIKIYKELIR